MVPVYRRLGRCLPLWSCGGALAGRWQHGCDCFGAESCQAAAEALCMVGSSWCPQVSGSSRHCGPSSGSGSTSPCKGWDGCPGPDCQVGGLSAVLQLVQFLRAGWGAAGDKDAEQGCPLASSRHRWLPSPQAAACAHQAASAARTDVSRRRWVIGHHACRSLHRLLVPRRAAAAWPLAAAAIGPPSIAGVLPLHDPGLETGPQAWVAPVIAAALATPAAVPAAAGGGPAPTPIPAALPVSVALPAAASPHIAALALPAASAWRRGGAAAAGPAGRARIPVIRGLAAAAAGWASVCVIRRVAAPAAAAAVSAVVPAAPPLWRAAPLLPLLLSVCGAALAGAPVAAVATPAVVPAAAAACAPLILHPLPLVPLSLWLMLVLTASLLGRARALPMGCGGGGGARAAPPRLLLPSPLRTPLHVLLALHPGAPAGRWDAAGSGERSGPSEHCVDRLGVGL